VSQQKSSQELRGEVEEARKRLAGTVLEIGRTVDETRRDIVRKAKTAAPYAAAVVGSYVIIKIFRKVKH
jgi:hypothetical protein